MSRYDDLQKDLLNAPRKWLVTGAAGFIGSHLVEKLLLLNQKVVGLDNFMTGHRRNLTEVKTLVTPQQWDRFHFIEGDIRQPNDCLRACQDADFVLHEAALGSVPRSLENPVGSHETNVNGFLNMLVAARDVGIKRMVYASSSSVYGDHSALPKVENTIGRPVSPYAATKRINEIYADVFQRCYEVSTIGLRYFNVFGPRQDPNGVYAAVIPKWFASLVKGQTVTINGDGGTSRDFCFVDNIVQANLLAALTPAKNTRTAEIFNIAYGSRITLLELYREIRALVPSTSQGNVNEQPILAPERPGDVRHSLADISAACERLGYAPRHSVYQGLQASCSWYLNRPDPSERTAIDKSTGRPANLDRY